MLKSRSGAVLILLLSMLLTGVACSRNETKTTTKPPEVAPLDSAAATANQVRPVPVASAPATPATAAANQPNPYRLALDKADGAKNISASAQSQDDWNLVASRWQQAIQLMRSVPASSPYRSLAKTKLAEYQRSLAYAKKQALRTNSSEVAFEPAIPLPASVYSAPAAKPARTAANSSGAERVFRAQIKRREGGTPVIDVTFNGRQTFEMIVDTGASGTVITEQMARSLGVQVVGKAKVDTASARGVEVPLAYVNSISVGGAAVREVIVAIGGSALDTGLLGHDFFGDYDVTVKRDVVEFRQR